jgi:hypothetical protein
MELMAATLRVPPGEVQAVARKPMVEVIVVARQTLYRVEGGSDGPLAHLGGQQAVPHGGQKLVDIVQFDALAGPHDEV